MEKILKGLYVHSPMFKNKIGKLNRAKGKNAQLIWQYVRFNQKYQRDFVGAQKLASRMSDDYAPDIFNQLGDRWSLYPWAVDPKEDILPSGFYFEVKANVRSFDVQKFFDKKIKRDAFWQRLRPSHIHDEFAKAKRQPPMQLLITLNPMADEMAIQNEIEKLTKKIKRKFLPKTKNVPATSSPALRGRGTPNLIENFCAYYLIHKLEMKSPKAITDKMSELLGIQRVEPYQGQHIKRMAKRFEKVAAISPWCFFLKPN